MHRTPCYRSTKASTPHSTAPTGHRLLLFPPPQSRAHSRLQLSCYSHTSPLSYCSSLPNTPPIMSSDPSPLIHVPGHARSKSASSQSPVTPRKTARNMNLEVQLSLKLATPGTKLVNRVRSQSILAPHRLHCMLLGRSSVRCHRRQWLLTSSPRIVENLSMLKHGVSPSSSMPAKLWSFKFAILALYSTESSTTASSITTSHRSEIFRKTLPKTLLNR